MGLFSKNETRKIPTFSVSVFGKLPFYKDFLYSSSHAGFAEFKNHADQGFDQHIRDGAERPYVLPDRCFFLQLARHKINLAGRIWESDDGLRGFPFIAAAIMPKGWPKPPLAKAWLCLEAVWNYLGEFGDFLRGLDDSSAFYAQIRGQTHRLDPVLMEGLGETQGESFSTLYDLVRRGERVGLPSADWRPERLKDFLSQAPFDPLPSFISVPVESNWAKAQLPIEADIIFGNKGLADWRPEDFCAGRSNTPETCESGGISEEDKTQRMSQKAIEDVLRQSENRLEDVPTAKMQMSDLASIVEPASDQDGSQDQEYVDTSRIQLVRLKESNQAFQKESDDTPSESSKRIDPEEEHHA